MNIRQIAKKMGRKGGLARAKSLSAEQRKQIASLGGRVRAISNKAVQRIEDNFIYLETLRELRKVPSVKSVSQVRHRLPGIYAKNRSA